MEKRFVIVFEDVKKRIFRTEHDYVTYDGLKPSLPLYGADPDNMIPLIYMQSESVPIREWDCDGKKHYIGFTASFMSSVDGPVRKIIENWDTIITENDKLTSENELMQLKISKMNIWDRFLFFLFGKKYFDKKFL